MPCKPSNGNPPSAVSTNLQRVWLVFLGLALGTGEDGCVVVNVGRPLAGDGLDFSLEECKDHANPACQHS